MRGAHAASDKTQIDSEIAHRHTTPRALGRNYREDNVIGWNARLAPAIAI
jgi:hypothetical protein